MDEPIPSGRVDYRGNIFITSDRNADGGKEMKRCTRCGEVKDESEFRKDKKAKSGLNSWCKKCYVDTYREYRKKRYHNDPEYRRNYLDKHNKESKIKYHTDPEYREKVKIKNENRRKKKILGNNPTQRKRENKCCKILSRHHELLKDDPERLSTEFIKVLSGCECERGTS